MNKLEQIRTALSYRPGRHLTKDTDVRLLLDYIDAAENVHHSEDRASNRYWDEYRSARRALGLEK